MDRQEEYEKVKSDSWGKCVLDGRLTKELVEEVFDTAYNIGKKHARGNDGMVSVSIDVVKTMYDEAKKTCSIFTKATCINAIESENLDKAMGAVDVLEKLFGKDFFGVKAVEPKRNAEQNADYIPVHNVRLQVATAAMQGMIGNWASRPVGEHYEEKKKSFARLCVDIADVLIAEIEKGGEE